MTRCAPPAPRRSSSVAGQNRSATLAVAVQTAQRLARGPRTVQHDAAVHLENKGFHASSSSSRKLVPPARGAQAHRCGSGLPKRPRLDESPVDDGEEREGHVLCELRPRGADQPVAAESVLDPTRCGGT